MPTLTNNFEGGTSGATITTSNAGGTGNTQFDGVTLSGGTATFTSTAAHGSLGSQFVNASGTGDWIQWDASLTNQSGSGVDTLYSRVSVRYSSIPTSEIAILRGMGSGGSAQRYRICINTSGQVLARNAGQAIIGTSTTVLSANKWWRIECSVFGRGSTDGGVTYNGSMEIRIYDGDSTSPTEVIGPLSGQNTGGPTYQTRFGHCAATSTPQTVSFDDAGVSDVGWLGPAVAVPLPKTWWPGALTDTGFTVSYNSTGITSAQLVASTASDLSVSPVTGSAVTVDSNGNAKVPVTGLTPDTVYYYGIKADGVLLDIGRGSLRTNPSAGNPASFSFAFGSCQQTNSNTPTFATIKDMTGAWGSARMLIHLGDLHYRDFGSSNTLADIVSQYKSSIAASNLAGLMSAMPVNYSWDNHDWGGADSNASTPRAADLKAAYRSFVPSYHLADDDQVSPTGAIYNSWVIGRVRFIDLDTRSERSNRADPESSSKRMLSDQQEQWLYSQLLEDEPVKIICSGIYWRQDSINGDRWGSYSTQWTRIKNWFAAHPDVQAYVICGDRHALAADDGSSAGCYLPQAVGAAFDQGGIAASEAWTNGYYTHDGTNLKSFGWIDVTDNGSSITIDFTGYTSDGVERVSMSTTFAVTAGLAGYWGVPL